LTDERRDFLVSDTGEDEAWATWVALQARGGGVRRCRAGLGFGSSNSIAEMEKAIQSTDRLLPILSEA
jgi:hypothetical protein